MYQQCIKFKIIQYIYLECINFVNFESTRTAFFWSLKAGGEPGPATSCNQKCGRLLWDAQNTSQQGGAAWE